MKAKTLFAAFIAIAMITGCSFNEYDQGAGIEASWPAREATGKAKDEPHGAHIVYKFDKTTGNVESIELKITNATDIALLDESLLKSRSAVSKTAIGAAGSRNGMLDNNTTVEGKAETESKLADSLEKLNDLIRDLKAPVTKPTDD